MTCCRLPAIQLAQRMALRPETVGDFCVAKRKFAKGVNCFGSVVATCYVAIFKTTSQKIQPL